MADGDVLPFPPRDTDTDAEVAAAATVREAIGDVLRDERHDQDRTLADVAGDAWVSLQYLSEIERGRKDVSSEVLESVCRSLDIHVADVLERAAGRLRLGAQRGGDITMLAA